MGYTEIKNLPSVMICHDRCMIVLLSLTIVVTMLVNSLISLLNLLHLSSPYQLLFGRSSGGPTEAAASELPKEVLLFIPFNLHV